MTAAKKLNLISVDDYLAAEFDSQIKHEYLGGVVYAMAGARNAHNRIASNTLVALGYRLRSNKCLPYNSDTKVRIRYPTHVRFYYPDAQVVCVPNPPNDSFQDHPVVIAEVLSRSTRRIDEGEKKDAYFTIPSLGVYLLVESDSPTVRAFRRTEQGFVREVYEGLETVFPLPEIGVDLPMAEIYHAVEFIPEPDEDEDPER
jgi:Uma2 family endonuclease